MNEPDYLWDRSGAPDPEISGLEEALGGLADRGQAPAFPPRRELAWPSLALAAAALLVACGAIVLSVVTPRAGSIAQGPTPTPTPTSTQVPAPEWEVTVLSGAPSCGARKLSTPRGTLAVGQWLETDAASRARLELPGLGEKAIGHVEVSPSSRVRLVATGPNERRLKLQIGRLTAQVNAPPRLFQVETPSAQAIDLGCAYVLDVDATGAARLTVTSGLVILVRRDRAESMVPRGATCRTDPRRGPGIPCYDDAPGALRAALAELEVVPPQTGWGARNPRYDVALKGALETARPRDTLPLWHLLQRVPKADRAVVYDRLSGFVTPPTGATRAGLMRLDRAMLDAWRKDLGWDW